jgi:hypothetical protein
MNTRLKIKLISMAISFIAGALLMAFYMLAFADHIHNWTLQSEFEDRNGRVVCEWECAEDYDNPHWRKTSGQGGCAAPPS